VCLRCLSVDKQNTVGGDPYQNYLLVTETKGRAIGVKFSVRPVFPLFSNVCFTKCNRRRFVPRPSQCISSEATQSEHTSRRIHEVSVSMKAHLASLCISRGSFGAR
jgi:hypothetical protein